ncbi:uncharacterized protein LY89DRAFT_196565 [Mollisia scopiformis]|uniref:Fucose-specific lectin n=1 Tax=Mollisia scopiformis TaxID=149040 RepID=A0A194WY48_MOLSC|nr:uncharacterized protein LY89DRAFT_196565 [Mollisia scopiformis]KUJ12898.1 hypothetical protein LY89DRAFT_196565 [Mollisia scopiformis]
MNSGHFTTENDGFPHEEPPPYIAAPGGKRDSFAESLPEYTTKARDAALPPIPKRPLKRYGAWICLGILVVIGAIIGGVVGGVFHRRSSNSDSYYISYNGTGYIQYNSPDFLALAAAECDQVTYVIYQKNNTGIYLRGQLKTGTYNGTSSPNIPEMQFHISQENFPATGTNITAVCQQTNSTGVNLYFYYVNSYSGLFNLVEASVSFPDPSRFFTELYPTIAQVAPYVASSTSNVPSITSVLLPPTDIRVYYVYPSSINSNSELGIWETSRTDVGAWTPPTMVPDILIFRNNAVFTATAVNVSSAPPEIHLLYIDGGDMLARKTWNESGWDSEIILPVEYSSNLTEILGMATVVEAVNPTVLRLYSVQPFHVHQGSISMESNIYTDFGVVNSPSYNAFPVITQKPPLIAATSPGLNSTDNIAQVFFVRASYSITNYGPRTAILNATIPVDGTMWSVSTLGQDPNMPPNSLMQMPS